MPISPSKEKSLLKLLEELDPSSDRANRIRNVLGLSYSAPVAAPVPAPVVAKPEVTPPVKVEKAAAPAPAKAPKVPKAKKSYQRKKTTKTKE